MDDLEHMLLDPSANPTYLQLSLLEAITDNFSDACHIGSGGYADVYMGQLRNGMVVAVKKLSKMVEINETKFIQEVDSLLRVKHKNIVRFLGYCSDTQGKMLNFKGKNVMEEERQRLLCFEFLPKGSLNKYISDASCGLEWHVRYDIIKGICFGLHYLHMQSNIAHMDLKPQNILMDDNMVAKIGDFGTSRFIDPNKTMVTLNIMGTLGYGAPEYIKNGLVSKKADIFSFGVVILELLTGSRHYDLTEESSIARYTVEVVGKWMKRLPNEAYSQQVCTCILIAIDCVSSDKDKRPTTERIINKLIKVESEIRARLTNEGQESVEGITNVIAGVVALVLILRLWVLTIGVAVIVLLCLQNPMTSWPRVVANECVSYDKDKRPTTECIINKLIKVESEIREKLINEGQESWSWMEGITNLTVGVVALVLFLQSWVLIIGVVVIVLLCLQNPMSSWPAIECVSCDKYERPTTQCINKLIKVESEIREKLIKEGQESWSWVEGLTNVTVGFVALVLIQRSWVLTIGVAVIVLLYLQNPMSSWPRVVWVILFGIGVVLTVLIRMNPRALSWVLLILKGSTAVLLIPNKVFIFMRKPLWRQEAYLLILLAKVVTAAMARVLSLILLDRRRWSWMTLLFTIVSVLAAVLVLLDTSAILSWAVVARTIMKAITPMNLLAIICVHKYVPDDLRKSRPWILFLAIEAVQATAINLVNPIISLPLVATVHSFIRFLAALFFITSSTLVLLSILPIGCSQERLFLFVQGGLSLILLYGPITLFAWLMFDIMTPLTIVSIALGFLAMVLSNLLLSTSESASLYLAVVALTANIVIIGGIVGMYVLLRLFLRIYNRHKKQ